MRIFAIPLCLMSVLLAAEGFAAGHGEVALPGSLPLHSESAVGPVEQDVAQNERAETIAYGDSDITLKAALSRALLGNPRLKAASLEIRAREARALQESLPPNPELGFSVEEFAGSGPLAGTDAAESTIELSQVVELGGKREKRAAFGSLETGLAEWDYEETRLQVLSQTASAFVDVVAAQERLHLAAEILGLAERRSEAVSQRVAAGKVRPLDESRALVALSASRMAVQTAQGALRTAQIRLSSMWGTDSAWNGKVEGDLYALGPAMDGLCEREYVPNIPRVARWETELAHRDAAVELERSRAVPDVTLSGGIKRFEETDDYAFVFGVSIPLPLMDRNKGSIQEAAARREKAEQERRASEISVRVALADVLEKLARFRDQCVMLEQTVIPAAQLAVDAARKELEQGKSGLLDMLDAHQALLDVKMDHVEAVARYQKSRAEAEGLMGDSIENALERGISHAEATGHDNCGMLKKGE